MAYLHNLSDRQEHLVSLENQTIRKAEKPCFVTFEPVGKKDGHIHIRVTVSPEMKKIVNDSFWGKWANAENIGKSEAEMIEYWNGKQPETPFSED